MIEYLSNIGLVAKAHAVSNAPLKLFSWADFTGSFTGSLPKGGTVESTGTLVGALINWFLLIVFLIAFIYMLIAGVKYITAGGDAAKATEARNGIINAIIGIIIVVLAFFIVQFAFNLGKGLN